MVPWKSKRRRGLSESNKSLVHRLTRHNRKMMAASKTHMLSSKTKKLFLWVIFWFSTKYGHEIDASNLLCRQWFHASMWCPLFHHNNHFVFEILNPHTIFVFPFTLTLQLGKSWRLPFSRLMNHSLSRITVTVNRPEFFCGAVYYAAWWSFRIRNTTGL